MKVQLLSSDIHSTLNDSAFLFLLYFYRTPEKLHTWIKAVVDAYHFSREGTLIREARDLMNPRIIKKLEDLKKVVENKFLWSRAYTPPTICFWMLKITKSGLPDPSPDCVGYVLCSWWHGEPMKRETLDIKWFIGYNYGRLLVFCSLMYSRPVFLLYTIAL